jgi:hypothetical protein
MNPSRLLVAWLLICASLAPVPARADQADQTAALGGERLSDWMLRQPADPYEFPFGLVWQVPRESAQQSFLQNQLLLQIQLTRGIEERQRHALVRMIKSLPATGRVSVPLADPRWLQAHPRKDPILKAGESVSLPKRPTTVSMLREGGTWCTVTHEPGQTIQDYVKRCEPTRFGQIDRAWVVQPNGLVEHVGVAMWNAQSQGEVGPGGLLWAPSRGSGWSEEVSSLLAEFLATQSYQTILSLSEATPPLDRTVLPPAVSKSSAPGPSRDLPLTSNDWGMLGLMQTPSARFGEAGEARFTYTRVAPYKRYNVFLQPFDWLEAGFRYSDITNRLYGPAELSGDQSLKDKSIDFRLRLLEETAQRPQLALGMIDFGGTGLFSSEFLVANKRFGDFDWSLGMAWGNLGTSGNIGNPFVQISDKARARSVGSASGGQANANAFFRGPAALFGGVQYHTPWDKWILKAEHDGNNYQNEPSDNNQAQRTALNLGVVHRYHPGLDISFGLERGDTIMLGFTLRTSVAKLHAPKVADQPTPRIQRARPKASPPWVATVVDLGAMSGWGVKEIRQAGPTLRVVFEGAGGAHWNDRVERIVAVLHKDAPADVDVFELIIEEQGILLTERVIDRDLWVDQNTRLVASSELRPAIAARPPESAQAVSAKRGAEAKEPLWERTPGRFGYALVPSWQQNIGGPDGFVLFRVGLATPFRFRIRENLSVSGAASLNIFDNYDKFKYDGPSLLPRVRTNMRQYMTDSRLNIPNLQLTQFGALGANNYYSVYGGYLEPMFGGVGAEWLHRPWHGPLAFGVDVNYVQQRDFDQFFGFSKAGTQTGYRVATGHATAYWDTGWNDTHARLSVGRYLAGDLGATLDLSRTFKNGVSVGAYATRTDVSAARFGEGSFDKGMYLRIPFDVMTTTRSGDAANLVYNPLTRDGGARLARNFTLYGATTAKSKRDTSFEPAQLSR